MESSPYTTWSKMSKWQQRWFGQGSTWLYVSVKPMAGTHNGLMLWWIDKAIRWRNHISTGWTDDIRMEAPVQRGDDMTIKWRKWQRHWLNRRCKRRHQRKCAVVTQYACFSSRRVSKQILQHRLNQRSLVQDVSAMTLVEDGSWSSMASG
jgi:hypothetical protein